MTDRGSVPAVVSFVCLAAASLAGCTMEDVELPAHVNLSPPEGELPSNRAPADGDAPASYLGLVTEANETDSLERLEVLPGARVRSVDPGGPVERAGLKPGDVILAVGGAVVGDADGFEALARSARPGEPVELEVRRGTTVFAVSAVAAPRLESHQAVELYRADPLKTRAGYTTVRESDAGAPRTCAEVARIFPRSPLPGAGLRVGDRIVALEDGSIASGHDLVRRLAEEHDFGDEVELSVLRDGAVAKVPVELWAPGRRISAVSVPILFNYESTLQPSRTRFYLLDLFIVSLFGYRREEGETEISFLSLFRFRTDYGELVEETPTPQEGEASR